MKSRFSFFFVFLAGAPLARAKALDPSPEAALWSSRPCTDGYVSLGTDGHPVVRIGRELYASIQDHLAEGDALVTELEVLTRARNDLAARLKAERQRPSQLELPSAIQRARDLLAQTDLRSEFGRAAKRATPGTSPNVIRSDAFRRIEANLGQQIESFEWLARPFALALPQSSSHSRLLERLKFGAAALRQALNDGRRDATLQAILTELERTLADVHAWSEESRSRPLRIGDFLSGREKARRIELLEGQLQQNRRRLDERELAFVRVNSRLVELTEEADAFVIDRSLARVRKWVLVGAGAAAASVATLRVLTSRQSPPTRGDK